MTASLFETRLLEKLRRDLGPDIAAALEDPATVEVMLNADGAVWVERLGQPMTHVGMLSPQRAEAVVRVLASALDKTVTRESPILEGELPPKGARFQGLVPPITERPVFAIRVPAIRVFPLEHYVASGQLDLAHQRMLLEALRGRENILVSGGTGSGKTTFVNALIAEMVAQCPDDRFVVLEDTREIQCTARNHLQLHTTRSVSMGDLLRSTLRLRPDRILVGEVRGPEALDLLQAWNTGHAGGAATVHANSASAALMRLELLVSMHPNAPRHIERVVSEAVGLVVQIERTPEGRRVREVVRVGGLHDGHYELSPA